jgi:hypothetical protein
MPAVIRSLFAAAIMSSWATTCLAITPQEKDKVRELVKQGGEFAHSGNFVDARDRLVQALALAKVPAIALYAGRAYENLRDLAKAAQFYRMASEMPLDESLWDNDKSKTEFQLRARDDARIALMQLLDRNSAVKIQLVGKGDGPIQATVDGAVLDPSVLMYEQPVTPGSHVVSVTQGARRFSQIVNVDRLEHKAVTFDLTPLPETATAAPNANPPTPPSTQPAPVLSPFEPQPTPNAPHSSSGHSHAYSTWAAFGVGATGLGAGVIAAIITNGKRSTLLSQGCSSDGICPRDRQIAQSDIDSHNTWRTVSTVGFIIGGVGMAAATTLWLTEPKAVTSPQIGLFAMPGTVGTQGTF